MKEKKKKRQIEHGYQLLGMGKNGMILREIKRRLLSESIERNKNREMRFQNK